MKYWTVAFDYGQLEARIIGMASKDRVFAQHTRAGYDVHNFWATRFIQEFPALVGERCFKDVTKAQIKKFRGRAKNEIVFPWIYDSHPASTAKLLGMPEEKVKLIYDEFWEEFWEMRQWKESVHEQYFKDGYVSTLMGSRRYGPLSFTKRVNTIIQGTGGYVNTGAMNRLSLLAYTLDKPQYQARLNIHDDLSFALPEVTLEEDIQFIAREMVRKTHDWMWIIPLQVEVQLGENWADIEEIATFETTEFDYGEKNAC